MIGFGFGINKQKRRSGAGGGSSGDGNVATGPWIQGTNTVMTTVGDRIRATAAGGNPRVYKHLTGLTPGTVYVFVGTAYYGTSTGAFTIFRVDDEPDLPDASFGYQEFIDAGDVSYTWDGTTATGSFTADSSGEAYIGIVAVVSGDGEYSEITDNFIVRDEDFVPSTGPRKWYVDFVSGSDSNSGLTSLLPKKTIAAVTPINTKDKIYLARGSTWREQLSTGGVSQVQIASYGSGKMPILDGADVIVGTWVVDGTYANVYNQTLTVPTDTALYLSFWEDGVRPHYVATKALCQATPGTWTMGTATGELDGSGAQVFSVHPTGSGNPNSNGKVYEYSRRLYGLVTGPRNSVYDLHMKRSIHNNGCAVFGQYNQAYRCIFEDGVKHNAYFSGNSRAEDCIVWKADWGERSNWTGIVNFELVGTNLSNINVGCVARVDKEYMDSAIAAGNGLTAFYSHTAGGVGDNWHAITYENCSSINCDTGFSVADTDTLVINSSYVEDGVVPFVVGGLQSTLTDVAAKSPGSTHNLQRFINAANGANTTIDGARVYATTTNDGLYYDTASTGTVSIGNSVFFLNDPASYANIIKSTGTKIVNMSGCVLNGDQSIADNSVLFTEAPGNISNNAYVGSVNFDFHISSVDYTTYADFETAHPELVNNSVNLIDATLFVDPANLDFNFTNPDPDTNPVVATGAGLIRPNVTYTYIPTNAEIDAM